MATAFGLFGMTDWDDVNRMTKREFRIRQRGHVMKMLERERDIHLQAYVNRAVKTVSKDGKTYHYKKFKDFYDEDKRRRSVLGGLYAPKVNDSLVEIARRMQHYEGEDY